MNAGEVENPSAFDSGAQNANTAPIGGGKKPPEPNQPVDPDEPIGDDGVNYDVYADAPKSTNSSHTNKTDVSFSAEDIRKRKKTNFFINIRGAKKLEREEQRRNAAKEKRILAEQRHAEKETARAEKAAAAKRTRRQKYDDSQEKYAHKEVAAEKKRQKKSIAAAKRKAKREAAREKRRALLAKIKKLTWSGKRKIITISAATTLAAFAVVWATILGPHFEKLRLEAEEKARQEEIARIDNEASTKTLDLAAEIQSKIFNEDCSFSECSALYEDAIKTANTDAEKIMLSADYARYIYDKNNDAENAIAILTLVEDLLKTNQQKEKYYQTAAYLYDAMDNREMVKHYSELLKEIYGEPEDGANTFKVEISDEKN